MANWRNHISALLSSSHFMSAASLPLFRKRLKTIYFDPIWYVLSSTVEGASDKSLWKRRYKSLCLKLPMQSFPSVEQEHRQTKSLLIWIGNCRFSAALSSQSRDAWLPVAIPQRSPLSSSFMQRSRSIPFSRWDGRLLLVPIKKSICAFFGCQEEFSFYRIPSNVGLTCSRETQIPREGLTLSIVHHLPFGTDCRLFVSLLASASDWLSNSIYS